MGTTASAVKSTVIQSDNTVTGLNKASSRTIKSSISRALVGDDGSAASSGIIAKKGLKAVSTQAEAQESTNSILTSILDQFSSVTEGLNSGTTFDWSDTTSSVSSAASGIDTSSIEKSLSSTLSSGGSGDSSTISDLTSDSSSSDTSALDDISDAASSTKSLASSTNDSTKQMNSYMQTLSKQISNLQSAISNLAEAESRGNWYNTFSIEKASDPTEVANEVAEILQKQIERSNARWA
jgi:hypothetical protein